jgi:hypothetical protein
VAHRREEGVAQRRGAFGDQPRFRKGLQSQHMLGHLETDGRVGRRALGTAERRHDGRIDPIEAAVLATVPQRAGPHLPAADRAIQILEEGLGMQAGVHDPVGRADQLLSAVTAHCDELLVAVGDDPMSIGRHQDGGDFERSSKFGIERASRAYPQRSGRRGKGWAGCLLTDAIGSFRLLPRPLCSQRLASAI